MQRARPPFRADMVGSLLRPAPLKAARARREKGEITAPALAAVTPETTNPVSDQCEANGVPCISTVAPWQPCSSRCPARRS